MNDELKYIIDKEKKIVVCIGEDCSQDLINELKLKSSGLNDYTKQISNILLNYCESNLVLSHKYTGVAYCSPFDVFDIEVGKKIARNKMRTKYNMSKAKKINSLLDNILKISESFYNNSMYYEDKMYYHSEIVQKYKEN